MYCVFTYTTPNGKTKHDARKRFQSKAQFDAAVAALKAAGNTNITHRYY